MKFEKRSMRLIDETIRKTYNDFIDRYNKSQSVNLLNYTLTYDPKFWTPNWNDGEIKDGMYISHANFAGIHTKEDINFPLDKNTTYIFSIDVLVEINDANKGKDSNIFAACWFCDQNIRFSNKNLAENRIHDKGISAMNSDYVSNGNGGLPLNETKRLYFLIDGKNPEFKDVTSFNSLRLECFYIGDNGDVNRPVPMPNNTNIKVRFPMLTKGEIISDYYPNMEEFF